MPLYNIGSSLIDNNNNNNNKILCTTYINNKVNIYKLYLIQNKFIDYKRHLHFREYYN